MFWKKKNDKYGSAQTKRKKFRTEKIVIPSACHQSVYDMAIKLMDDVDAKSKVEWWTGGPYKYSLEFSSVNPCVTITRLYIGNKFSIGEIEFNISVDLNSDEDFVDPFIQSFESACERAKARELEEDAQKTIALIAKAMIKSDDGDTNGL